MFTFIVFPEASGSVNNLVVRLRRNPINFSLTLLFPHCGIGASTYEWVRWGEDHNSVNNSRQRGLGVVGPRDPLARTQEERQF